MKRVLSVALATLTLSACSPSPSPSSNGKSDESSSHATGLTSSESSSSNESSQPVSSQSGSEVLVAYFSVTNHTKKIANYAQEYLQCDIFEIVPSEPYTEADIDYNSDCRANREQNDSTARPTIRYTVGNIAQYDTIVLGYPIWWGQAPKILYTFIESYDFTGKIIIPFCTSGSSPIGTSATNLARSAPSANWVEGRRFSASASKEEVEGWLSQYKGEEETMNLAIDETKVDVTWEDNASVKALEKALPLSIDMHRYGGFEQVGSIGRTLPSEDQRITTNPGDIVLYASNQIVVFFGSNTWEYTRLGHLDLEQSELDGLLNKESVTLTLG